MATQVVELQATLASMNLRALARHTGRNCNPSRHTDTELAHWAEVVRVNAAQRPAVGRVGLWASSERHLFAAPPRWSYYLPQQTKRKQVGRVSSSSSSLAGLADISPPCEGDHTDCCHFNPRSSRVAKHTPLGHDNVARRRKSPGHLSGPSEESSIPRGHVFFFRGKAGLAWLAAEAP